MSHNERDIEIEHFRAQVADLEAKLRRRDLKKDRTAKFVPPTIAQIAAYAQAIEYSAFPSGAFCDHYDAQGWVRANGRPVVDWRALVRKWIRDNNPGRDRKPNLLDKPPEDQFGEIIAKDVLICADCGGPIDKWKMQPSGHVGWMCSKCGRIYTSSEAQNLKERNV